MIDEIDSPFPVVKQLENSVVNLDELDFLAKRLDGDQSKLGVLVEAIDPETPEELLCLARNFEDFAVAPDISTPEEYGR